MLFTHGSGSSDAKAIGFFKILPVGHLQGVEFMIIPSDFERKYKITLPNPLILRIPTGVEWEVSWIKRDYDIWFKQDWKRFAFDCSLRGPHFLVFKYEGGSRFEVRIFDDSYYDIDYSSIRCTNGATATNHHDEVECDESVDIVEINDDPDVFLESEIQTQQPPNKTKTNTKSKCRSRNKEPSETKSAPSRRKLNTTKIKKDLVATQQNVSAGASRGRRRSMVRANSFSKAEVSPKQNESAMARAINYQNENKNPSFICMMTKTYATKSFMGIPKHFCNEYLAGYEGNATIRVPDEDRSWPILMCFQHSSNQSYISTGWRAFCKEYKLKFGDVCVFERIRCEPLSFKVIIFREREEPDEQGYGYESNQLCKDKLKRKSIQNVRKYSSGNEQVAKRRRISFSCLQTEDSKNSVVEDKNYKILIRNYHRKVRPTLGEEFLNKFPTCKRKYVKFQVGRKWWPVRVLYYPSIGQGLLSAGWRTFMRECKLEVERMWEFNMIDEKNLLFEVSISRHRQSAT